MAPFSTQKTSKGSTKNKNLELLSEFNKVARYKIKAKNQPFEHMETGIKTTASFIIAPEEMKYLGVN